MNEEKIINIFKNIDNLDGPIADVEDTFKEWFNVICSLESSPREYKFDIVTKDGTKYRGVWPREHNADNQFGFQWDVRDDLEKSFEEPAVSQASKPNELSGPLLVSFILAIIMMFVFLCMFIVASGDLRRAEAELKSKTEAYDDLKILHDSLIDRMDNIKNKQSMEL